MMKREIHEKHGGKIARVFLLYWIVLVMWQNIGQADLRTGLDLLIKMGLIVMLSIYYLMHSRGISRNILTIIAFSLGVIAVFGHSNDGFSGSVLIAYTYPVLLALLAFGLGNSFQIDKKELSVFLNGVILIMLYCSIYALVFCKHQRLNLNQLLLYN